VADPVDCYHDRIRDALVQLCLLGGHLGAAAAEDGENWRRLQFRKPLIDRLPAIRKTFDVFLAEDAMRQSLRVDFDESVKHVRTDSHH